MAFFIRSDLNLLFSDKVKGPGAYLLEGANSKIVLEMANTAAKNSSCKGIKHTDCQCSSCVDFPNSPGVILVEPEGSSSIGIEDVSELSEQAYESKSTNPTVFILHRINRMTSQAASSLLKVIEDFSDRAIFIGTAPDEDGTVLETLYNRFSCFRAGTPSKKEITSDITDFGIGTNHAKRMASLSSTLPIFGNELEYSEMLSESRRIIKHLVSFDIVSAMRIVADHPKNHSILLQCLQAELLELSKVRLGVPERMHGPHDLDSLKRVADKTSENVFMPVLVLMSNHKDRNPVATSAFLVFALHQFFRLQKQHHEKKKAPAK